MLNKSFFVAKTIYFKRRSRHANIDQLQKRFTTKKNEEEEKNKNNNNHNHNQSITIYINH